MGHWYSSTGQPMHRIVGKNGKERDTTLRDAKEHNLLPSVTEVMKIIAKPSLETWKQKQSMMSALTLPRNDGETDADFVDRIMDDSKQEAIEAAQIGTDIHAAIDAIFKGNEPQSHERIARFAHQEIINNYGDRDYLSELRVVNLKDGYAGTCDLYAPGKDGECGILLDIKTKDFTEDTAKKVKAYDEHAMQLAAYASGLDDDFALLVNVFVSRADPVVVLHEWGQDDSTKAHFKFHAALNLWRAMKDYDPREENLNEHD